MVGWEVQERTQPYDCRKNGHINRVRIWNGVAELMRSEKSSKKPTSPVAD
jgi:hypothetical protein